MTTTPILFDDRNIDWQPLGEFKHFLVAVYQVDEARKIVDFIIKYEPNGELKEVRPVGGYTSSPPAEPHSEGGGAEGAVIFYSLRADDERLFELYDDEMKSIATLGIADFAGLLR